MEFGSEQGLPDVGFDVFVLQPTAFRRELGPLRSSVFPQDDVQEFYRTNICGFDVQNVDF